MGRGGEGKGRGKGGDVKSNCMLVFGFGSSPSPLTACSFLPPSSSRCLSNGSTTQAGTTLHVEEDEGGCPAGPPPQDHPGLPL